MNLILSCFGLWARIIWPFLYFIGKFRDFICDFQDKWQMTESIRATSKEKIYQELGVEDAGVENFAFFMRSWKMKILNKSAAWFLLGARFTRLEIYIPLPNTNQNSFFPSTIIKCNNLDPHLRKSEFFGF